MSKDGLKEIRKNALQNISNYKTRLGDLVKEKEGLKPTAQKERYRYRSSSYRTCGR